MHSLIPALIALGLLLGSGPLRADAVCALCRRQLEEGEAWVMARDQVANVDRLLCLPCSKLEVLCFLCSLPVREGGRSLSDGRHYCARDTETAQFGSLATERAAREARSMMDRPLARFMTLPEANVEWVVEDLKQREHALSEAPARCRFPGVRYAVRRGEDGSLVHVFAILNGLPRERIRSAAAHLYVHAWLMEQVPERRRISAATVEAFCDLVAGISLEAMGETAEAERLQAASADEGQLEALMECHRIYNLHRIQEWMKYGAQDRLLTGDDARLRQLDETLLPKRTAPTPILTPARAPVRAPEILMLHGILGTGDRRLALINDATLATGEEANAHVGTNVIRLKCLEIGLDGVAVQVNGGEPQVLRLRPEGGP